jgi:hypothetical protein
LADYRPVYIASHDQQVRSGEVHLGKRSRGVKISHFRRNGGERRRDGCRKREKQLAVEVQNHGRLVRGMNLNFVQYKGARFGFYSPTQALFPRHHSCVSMDSHSDQLPSRLLNQFSTSPLPHACKHPYALVDIQPTPFMPSPDPSVFHKPISAYNVLLAC